jgi:multiple sugar transport system permease protein
VTIVPLQLMAGLAVALALNQGLRGLKLYRVIYFMPVVTSVVASALVFQWMFNRDYGVISALFWWLGDVTGLLIAPPDWLNSSFWAKPAVVILTVPTRRQCARCRLASAPSKASTKPIGTC